MILARMFMLLIVALPLSACALSSLPIEGRVLDIETRKPLSGVIVVATWSGRWHAFVDSQSSCYHVETATTDNEGRFRLSGWIEKSKGLFFSGASEPGITVYKAGYTQLWPYERKRKDNAAIREDYEKRNITYMEPFRGTREERLAYLMNSRGKECGTRDGYAPKLIPLYRALYEEAKSIAVTKQDITVVNSLHYSIDDLELGSAAAAENQDKGVYGR